MKYFGTWRKTKPDWSSKFPALKDKTSLDVLTDLMPLDVGKLYTEIATVRLR